MTFPSFSPGFAVLMTLVTLNFAAGQYRAICSKPTMEVVEGDSIHLRCHLDPQVDLSAKTADWKKSNKVVHAYRYKQDRPNLQMDRYKNRTVLSHEGLRRGDLTLLISSAQLADTGSFKCNVPKLSARCTVNVTVVNRDQQNRTQTGDSSTNGPPVEEVTHLNNPDATNKDPIIPIVVVGGVVVAAGVVGGVILLLVKRGKIQRCVTRLRGQTEHEADAVNGVELQTLQPPSAKHDKDHGGPAANGSGNVQQVV